MAYDKKRLFDKALEVCKGKYIFCIEDVAAYMGVSKSTIYSYFELGSDELNAIKDALDKNKAMIRVKLRQNWEESDKSAGLQAMLYKICAPSEELKRLSSSYTPLEDDKEQVVHTEIHVIKADEHIDGDEA